jgi:hypothetical protein
MKRDRVAEHNRRMWERLAKAGIPYTRRRDDRRGRGLP